ncbi:hypothetical protein C6Y14_40015 [Streptomyces dioscori]|uniref:Protein kinase domain-containing protein n=1 Tax=Streptomyces dioscori TaxID=2109333 RepID=A0A2P8PUZ1_9ACTN|nr:hypothetical protein C6Y14_40015 [Streptomyces dioscori]
MGDGGQGAVYGVPVPPGRFAGESLVYKEFSKPRETDSDVLYDMIVFREELSRSHRHDWAFLDERLTWPLAMIYTGSRPTQLKPSLNPGMQVLGFLMPRLKPEYQFSSMVLGGSKAQEMAFLLNEDAFAQRIELPFVSDENRLCLLSDLAATLIRLHRHGVTVGDLSPKNILFTLVPTPTCLLIDCDSMRLRGRDVQKQVETGDWEVPEAAKATTASDLFKFGLIATRLFNRHQTSTDLGGLRGIATDLVHLAERSVDLDLRTRPSPEEWLRALEQARSQQRQKVRLTQSNPHLNAWIQAQSPVRPAPPVGQQLPQQPRSRPQSSRGPTAPQPTPARIVAAPSTPTRPTPSNPTYSRVGRAVTMLLVVFVIMFVIGLLLGMTSGGSTNGSSSTVDSTVKSDTGPGGPSRAADVPGRAEAPGASVDYSQVADEPAADEVATLFARFYGAVNERDYDRAMTYYDPASNVVDTGSAASREEWTHAMSTTEETDIALRALSVSGPYTLATVNFTSHQDVGYGPVSNPKDTCDEWTVTYHLTHTKGYRILKAPREEVSYASC